MGGLARRANYIRAFQEKYGQIPFVYLDAGQVFSDLGYNPSPMSASVELQRDAIVRNEWVLRGYQQMQPDTVVNLTPSDLPFAGPHVLEQRVYQRRLAEAPFVGSFVSANYKPLRENLVAPPAFVIKELRGPRIRSPRGDNILRLGIIGIARQADAAKLGFDSSDPFKTLKQVLPQVRPQADVVVVMAALNEGDVYRVARENPQIDIVIGNPGSAVGTDSRKEKRALVVMANYETKLVGELRLYQDETGKLVDVKNRYGALDELILDEPRAARLVAQAHKEFTDVQLQMRKDFQPNREVATGAVGNFVTSAQCASCHQQAYQVWERSGHAHAMATLEKRNQQFDQSCVGCHTVGFQQGGFTNLNETPQLANVQCESCHGPAKLHVVDPSRNYSQAGAAGDCVRCHTQPNSPDFNFATYWPRIAHGKN